MAIESTYRKLLIDDYVRDRLEQGTSLITASELIEEVEGLLENVDTSVPSFTAEDHHVERLEYSSANKYNLTFGSIYTDMRALYKEMLLLSSSSINNYERWKIEAESLEKRLEDLEDRIENLLLVTQDTEGYFGYIADNFTDTAQIDLDLSSVSIDLNTTSIEMQPTEDGITRIFMNRLGRGDVSVRVRNQDGFNARTDLENATVLHALHQSPQAWSTAIQMTKQVPVTVELTVRLGDEAIELSQITMQLHHSGQSSAMQVTPLYSTDNHNWVQLPTNSFTQEVRSNAVFSFTPIQARWIKFLLTKAGPDNPIDNRSVYHTYQFGFKEIALFNRGFSSDSVQSLVTEPQFIQGEDGVVEFEKLTLDVCERIESDTGIRYYVTVSNDETVPVDANTIWAPISPIGRSNPLFPRILVVGDVDPVVLGDTETVQPSYALGESPALAFKLIQDTGTIVETDVTATESRYTFRNSNERILNYQIDDSVNINLDSLQVFRNVGEKGLTEITTNKVRDITRGWKFEDPWYSCVIEVINPEGIALDVGDQPMYVDDIKYTGIIDSAILTGKTSVASGIHRIRVHKNNWKHVTTELDTLDELKAADSLYPYNHKLLIEGYSYGSGWSSTEQQLYTGVDLFAETLMRRVGVFDMASNVAENDYTRYSLDQDAPDTNPTVSVPTTVFLFKVDESNPDFQNERFMIRFNLVNQRRKYLRLKADLSTTDETVTPGLTSYKLKLG